MKCASVTVNNRCVHLALELSDLSNTLRLQSLRQTVVQSAAGLLPSCFLILHLQEKHTLFLELKTKD